MRNLFTLLFILFFLPVLVIGQSSTPRTTKPHLVKKNSFEALDVTKHRLDSIVYDDSKDIYYYDSEQRPIKRLHYKLNKETNKWYGEFYFEQEYNEKGFVSAEISYKWDSSNEEWNLDNKNEYEYNTQGYKTSKIYYDWNETDNDWKTSSKNEFTYDDKNNIIEEKSYSWSSSDWELSTTYKKEYTYDASNNILTSISSQKNSTAQEWQNMSKYEYTYNQQGRILTKLYYSWNMEENTWVSSSRIICTYNAQQIILSFERLEYVWNQFTKAEYSHDNLNNVTTMNQYYKTTEDGSWINIAKIDLIYNYSYTDSDMILPSADGEEDEIDYFAFYNMPTKNDIYKWNASESDWRLEDEGTFYYSTHNFVGIQNHNNMDISVFPNPTSDNINLVVNENINNVSFKLYDVNGKELISKNVDTDYNISIQNLPAGIYFYKINSDAGQKTGKITKR